MPFRFSTFMRGSLLLSFVLSVWPFDSVYAQNTPMKSGWQKLNEKAMAANSGSEPAVRALADAVFQVPEFPELEVTPIKERVVRAELAFHHGKHQLIPDSRIAEAINDLARSMSAPKYAFASVRQIRELRASLLPLLPNILGSRLGQDNTVNKSFSPLEASYVAMLMIRQKLFNPYFQVTQEEWDEREKAKKSKSQKEVEQEFRKAFAKNPKSSEMTHIMSHHFSHSETETIEVLDRTLDLMGVER